MKVVDVLGPRPIIERIPDLKAALDELQRRLEEATTQLDALKLDNASLAAQKKALEDEFSDVAETTAKLKAEIKAAEDRCDAMDA